MLELPLEELPRPQSGEDPALGGTASRWLASLGLGIAPIAHPQTFSWPGPWIARVCPPQEDARYVVMFGVPSGLVWDPTGGQAIENDWIEAGFLISAADIALARPGWPTGPSSTGTVEGIFIAAAAGESTQSLQAAHALPERGLEGDRYATGAGTFQSGVPGSALTLIEAEVCESFDPPLGPGEHRRNIVTRGIELNALVGRDFNIGEVRCHGMRLCEPCTVVDRYASRPVLRPLVHRGGLRADILEAGQLALRDVIRAN